MTLRAIKVTHTVVWTIFASCVVAIPILTWRADYRHSAILIGIVFVEVLVLLCNDMRCPLTPVAARYTSDRRDNFDIYLPEWLARHNKLIFGVLYVAGVVYTIVRWGYARH